MCNVRYTRHRTPRFMLQLRTLIETQKLEM